MEHKFQRDGFSNALINQDSEGLAGYRTQKERSEKMDTLEHSINSLKSDVQEIKDLIKQLNSRG
jgi:TolA-binding protein